MTDARARGEYEDDIRRTYQAHGDAPPSPRDDPVWYYHRQLAKLQRQQVALHDHIVALEQHTVSPRTTQRLRETYCAQAVISPQTQKRLQDHYDADIDERSDLVRNLLVGVSAEFQNKVEPEPEAVSPDPQLAAVGGSGGVSSVDGA
jgi:hypothetical protein